MRGAIAYLVIVAALAWTGAAWATHHGYPHYWLRGAACIRFHESRDNWRLVNHPYEGAYEFMLSTWATFAPRSWTRHPAEASPAEQNFVAWRIWIHNGRSWGANNQWPNTARICGVR